MASLPLLLTGTGKFTAVLSQADKYPVLGAEAVWHFKQGLSERIRTAIAGSRDEDLHAVAVQAKRVDAELSIHVSALVGNSAPSNKALAALAGAAGKRGAAGGSSGAAKKARVDGASKELISLRIQKKICTDCAVAKDDHTTGSLGQGCTADFVKATHAEVVAMSGKAKA